jgi:hypothetical protein
LGPRGIGDHTPRDGVEHATSIGTGVHFGLRAALAWP